MLNQSSQQIANLATRSRDAVENLVDAHLFVIRLGMLFANLAWDMSALVCGAGLRVYNYGKKLLRSQAAREQILHESFATGDPLVLLPNHTEWQLRKLFLFLAF